MARTVFCLSSVCSTEPGSSAVAIPVPGSNKARQSAAIMPQEMPRVRGSIILFPS
jgi:hypothetical protein